MLMRALVSLVFLFAVCISDGLAYFFQLSNVATIYKQSHQQGPSFCLKVCAAKHVNTAGIDKLLKDGSSKLVCEMFDRAKLDATCVALKTGKKCVDDCPSDIQTDIATNLFSSFIGDYCNNNLNNFDVGCIMKKCDAVDKDCTPQCQPSFQSIAEEMRRLTKLIEQGANIENNLQLKKQYLDNMRDICNYYKCYAECASSKIAPMCGPNSQWDFKKQIMPLTYEHKVCPDVNEAIRRLNRNGTSKILFTATAEKIWFLFLIFYFFAKIY